MEVTKSYQTGDIIFKQDEIGNAMFLIQQGQVEIVKKSPQGELFLTLQNPGEIVGLLTFFNSGHRLASARARTPVTGTLIEKKPGQDPLAHLPGWIQLVLKEFSLRLTQSNDQLAHAADERAALLEKTLNRLTISLQISDTACEIAPFQMKKIDGGKDIVMLEPLLESVQKCLGYGREMIDEIFGIFTNLGMVKVELNPDTNKEMLAANNLPRLRWYADFIRSAKTGKNRKLLQTEIPFRFRKVLFALRDFVQKTNGDIQKLNSIDYAILLNTFEKHTKLKPDAAAFEAGAKAGVLEMKKSGPTVTVIVNPTLLVRTLIAMNVAKRLRSDPSIRDDEEQAIQ